MPENIKKVIVSVKDIKGGKPTIRGTRVTVSEIISFLEDDSIVGKIIKNLAKEDVIVTPDEIFAALEYARIASNENSKED